MSQSGAAARLAAPAQLAGMLQMLTVRGDGVAAALSEDAIGELERWDDVRVAMLTDDTSSPCGISGMYHDESDPPLIGIGPSNSAGRAQFTALHELGHHLQRTDAALIDRLAAQEDRGVRLEEIACDQFAARILIPDSAVDAVLTRDTPTAAEVVALWRTTAASRAAVCVAASQRLRSPGHVLLLDDAGVVEFSASNGEYPLRRGSDQSSADIVARALRSTASVVSSRNTRFSYQDGAHHGQELYAQATGMGGKTLVVAVTDSAPWEQISLPSTAVPVLSRVRLCVHCGEYTGNGSSAACSECGLSKCEHCGRCECASAVQELLCETCFLVKPAQLFLADGRTCNDHA